MNVAATARTWATVWLLAWLALALSAVTLQTPENAARLLVLLVIAPVLEEAVFRAGLQDLLMRSRYRPIVCVGIGALAFTAAHALARPEPMTAAVLLPGLLLGLVYQHTRSLRACIALHAAMNACWLGFIAR
jgi:membrane protease YdiL (CAAX protease family)